MDALNLGDTVTIAGVFQLLPNPDRKWWHFWKPKFVRGPLTKFRVVR